MNHVCTETKQTLFEPHDFRLMEHALSINKDLEMAVFLTKLAKTRLSFPIRDLEGLVGAFDRDDGRVQCRDRVLRWKDMKKFIKSRMFPIYDEYDFLSKAFMALCIGTECHHHERRYLELRREDCEVNGQSNEQPNEETNDAYRST